MTEPTDRARATRRRFLAGAAGLAASGATATRADNAKNLPPNVADWTRQLGDGVGVRAYGNPSKYEKDVIRRTVPWLTATPESSVSFTPLHAARRHHHAERTVLRAPSRRHRRNRSGRLPADVAWPGRQAADLHARRAQAPAARQQDLFSRMRRQFRHGMARRPAQRLPIHPRHGALRAIHRRAVEAVAGRRPASSRMRNGSWPKAATPRR